MQKSQCLQYRFELFIRTAESRSVIQPSMSKSAVITTVVCIVCKVHKPHCNSFHHDQLV